MNNKNKIISASILAGSMIFSVGCSSDNVKINETTSSQSFKNDVDFTEDKNSLYGEIISINENNVTIALGDFNMPQKNNKPNEISPNGTTNNKQDSNKERPVQPMDNKDSKPPMDENDEKNVPPNIEMSEMPSEEKPFEIIKLTGEEKVITISNDIMISKLKMKRPNTETQSENKESNKEQLTLLDLVIGDIIKVNYNDDNTKIESIDLISSPVKESEDTPNNSTDKVAKG